jgi:uncharacterized membrane protein YdjX (TVP38/TMEM64 family)
MERPATFAKSLDIRGMTLNKKTIIKLTTIVAVVIFLIWFNYGYLNLKPEDIRGYILQAGVYAPIIFVIIYTLRPLILFPVTILSLSGGLAFGVWKGSVLTLIGAVGGAVLSFWIARKLGKGFRIQKDRGMLEKLEEQMQSRGFVYVFFVRLLPFVPFDLVSYASGISRIRFRTFLFATFLGAIPGTIIYNFIGANLGEGNIFTSLIAFGILILVTTLLLIYRRKMGWYA